MTYGIDNLADSFGGLSRPGNLDFFRIFQGKSGDFLHLFNQGRGKKHGLSLTRKPGNDGADIGQKTHIQHSIRLIQHQIFNGIHFKAAVFKMIQKPSGSGDDDGSPAGHEFSLTVVTHASDDGSGFNLDKFSAILKAILDLRRQLASRNNYKSAEAVSGKSEQVMKNGQNKGSRFSASGLSAPENVLSFESDGNSLGLNRRRLFPAERFDGAF